MSGSVRWRRFQPVEGSSLRTVWIPQAEQVAEKLKTVILSEAKNLSSI
jgi:hypothetical protein